MDPREEYARRLAERRAESARQDRLDGRIAAARLGAAILAGALLWVGMARYPLALWWLPLPGISFVTLVIRHARVTGARECAARAAAYYQRAIDRLENRWAGQGEDGGRFLDTAHPYAEDLDLFGKGSLFQLLCTARTSIGEETLARWLLAPAAEQDIYNRHDAARDLRDRLDLREALAVAGEDVRSELDAGKLVEWSERAPSALPRYARVLAALLALCAGASLIGWLAFGTPRDVFLAFVALEAVFALSLRTRVLRFVHAAGDPARGIDLLSDVLRIIEREQFSSASLITLRRALDIDGALPSLQIARLDRLIELLDSRDNVLVRIIGPPLLWTTQVALAIESWRLRCGPAVRRWLDAVGEIEALSALAGYGYEHPEYPLPEFSPEGARFEAEGLAHPLLAHPVGNDVRLGPDLRVLIVSGSNMSGKSTLLRSVGCNAVLAMMGAPVRARRLRLSPLAVGASIRVVDSLQTGTSRFQAEIIRLRHILDMTSGGLPVLFLLDELLHGTNSHDRRIGAEAVVRALVDRGAIGLVTTHDLALAGIASAPHAANAHFEDHLENGVMTFDYRMREGVVRHSNAIELMRAVGLPV